MIRSKQLYRLLTVGVIILLGGVFRFTAINWDNFGAYHPDERNISWAVTRIHFFDQLNPQFFAYGGLPIYLYRGLAEFATAVSKNSVWLTDWGHIAVIGRSVSAVLSTLSIGLIFLVGEIYFSTSVGLVAATFLAVSPWAIEQAHFSTTETMLVFFLLIITYLCHTLVRELKIKTVLLTGVFLGLALAAKTTSLLFGLIPLAALALPLIGKKPFTKEFLRSLARRFLLGVLLTAVSSFVFFLLSPYTVLDFRHFYESMTYESGVALGRFTVVYTLQFVHTTPYLYQIMTMLWQAGPLVIVGLAGLIALVVRGVKMKNRSIGVLLIFPLVYFGWVGFWYAKFSRYNVPFLPYITLAAAWFMVTSLAALRRRHIVFIITATLYTLLCVLSLAWTLAFFTIYLRPQTKTEATYWIMDHIPAGSNIYTEHWNDGLPLDIPGVPSYNRELLTVYEEPDDNSKRQYYANKLIAGDFIILSTRRIWATMPNLTMKYPVTSLFYKKLLAGELGYQEVATFTSYPQLFGVVINDDSAEESLQVFDHPTVRIFQNTGHFSQAEFIELLR